MAKTVTLSSDVPGDEGANVETLSFRIPAAKPEGNAVQVTLDASEDIRARFDQAVQEAHEKYVRDLTKSLKFVTDHAKVTEVKRSEPKPDGAYSGDRAVNNAIREWHNGREGVTKLKDRGRINDDVKAAFWQAVENGEVADPRKAQETDDSE